MKRFIILFLTAFLMACGGIKMAGSSYQTITENGASKELDQYTFNFNKKAGDYLEIVEVKLLNEAKNYEESVPFKVMDKGGKDVILDVKGRSEFAVVATKPQSKENILASSALVVYRSEKEGDKKYYTIKKIGE